jgi:hypothetical protein
MKLCAIFAGNLVLLTRNLYQLTHRDFVLLDLPLTVIALVATIALFPWVVRHLSE